MCLMVCTVLPAMFRPRLAGHLALTAAALWKTTLPLQLRRAVRPAAAALAAEAAEAVSVLAQAAALAAVPEVAASVVPALAAAGSAATAEAAVLAVDHAAATVLTAQLSTQPLSAANPARQEAPLRPQLAV